MSKKSEGFETEIFEVLEKCKEMYKKNKIIWGHRFWMDVAKDAGISAGCRNWAFLKHQIAAIFKKHPQMWAAYFPNAPDYVFNLFMHSTIRDHSAGENLNGLDTKWSIEDERKVLLAVIQLDGVDRDFLTSEFWTSILELSGIKNCGWKAVKDHFFKTLAQASSQYLSKEEEMKLIEKMASANYGQEDVERETLTQKKKAKLGDMDEKVKHENGGNKVDQSYGSVMKNMHNQVLEIQKPVVHQTDKCESGITSTKKKLVFSTPPKTRKVPRLSSLPLDNSKAVLTKAAQLENSTVKPGTQIVSELPRKQPTVVAQSRFTGGTETNIDSELQIVSFVVPPNTEQGQKMLHHMMETYATLELLDDGPIRNSQAQVLKYYQSIVRALGMAAESQIKLLDEGDAARSILRTRSEMDEFPYFHYMAAILLQDERNFLKALGGGIMRASVLARDRLRGMRIMQECTKCQSKRGKFF